MLKINLFLLLGDVFLFLSGERSHIFIANPVAISGTFSEGMLKESTISKIRGEGIKFSKYSAIYINNLYIYYILYIYR